MSFVYGVLGAVLVVAVFVGGFLCGRKLTFPEQAERVSEADRELTETERRERDRLVAEQDAFRQMMSYTADTAYGVTAPTLEEEVSN